MQAIFLTNAEQVAAQFHLAAPLLQSVIDQPGREDFSVSDLRRMTAEGRAITMLVCDQSGPVFSMVFEIVLYPRQTVANIMALGGSKFAEGEAEFGDAFRQWCRDAGATAIEASCRPAVARMLRKFGFEVVCQVVRSPL